MSDYVRKLATVEVIHDIFDIPGADLIQGAKILGWECVIVRDSHKIGEKIVYCSIDSFLPIKPEYEFLRTSSYRNHSVLGEGFKIRTIKLKKQISQGLVMPLPEEFKTMEVGTDLTEILGIQKWEQPLDKCLGGFAKGNFPQWVRRTDLERCISEETKILSEDGIKSIKEICEQKYSGRVLSFNHISQENEYQKVQGWYIKTRKKDQWLKIKTKSGKELIVTKNHRIWIEQLECYRLANECSVGDLIKTFL